MSGSKARRDPVVTDDPLAAMRGGGFNTVLFVVLAGGLGALALLSSGSTEPLVLTIMALLATVGVFFLFGLAAGHIRISERLTDTDILRALAHSLENAVQITSPAGDIVFCNQAFGRLTGLNAVGAPKTLEEAFASEPQSAQALFRLSRAAEAGELREEEVCLGAGAQARWLRFKVDAFPAPAEAGRHVLWQIADVTEARRREAGARSFLERTLAAYDQVAAGLLVVGADGRIDHMNATLVQWLGHDSEAYAARLADIASHDGAALLHSIARRGRNGIQTVDLDLVRKDGRIWPARLTVSVRSGVEERGGLVAVILDRMADAKGERGGRGSEVRFSRLFQSAPIGIATIAGDGRVVSSNAAFTRLLVDDGGAEQGSVVDLLARGADAEMRTEIEAAFAAAASGRANVPSVEVSVGDKAEFTRRVQMCPLVQAGSAREAVILYVIDATEQKALELKYTQSQKMEAVGKLAGTIAHDFNNVLTAIIGFSDLLLSTHKAGDPAYPNIRAIKSEANRAAALVSQLLAYSRRQQLKPEVLKLGEVLTDLSMLLNRLLGEKVELKISQGRDLWYVKADRTQFGQVIINLAVNARDAMTNGGRLTVRTRNVSERDSHKLAELAIPVGEYVLIEVEDTGHGMTPEVMARIFEPFFTTKGVGKGTGLGLATVYGIVKQTGGFIYPESAPDKGTTFRVWLPRHHVENDEELAPLAAVKKERRRDLTGTGRVLLVEDEDAVRNFATQALKRQGYEVLSATNGAEGLEVFEANGGRVDLVVSDVLMPEMDGPTLLRHLRSKRPDLKFVFMSGYPDDAFKNTLDPAVEFAFLQKPFTLAQFAAKVKEQLGR